MSDPIAPGPSEYRDAMRAWSLAAAKWLGIDPEQAFRLEVMEHGDGDYGGSTVEVTWLAPRLLTTRVGHLRAPGYRSDGDTVTVNQSVSLDWDDSRAFWEAVGPKPKRPWETPEALVAFDQLRRRSSSGPSIEATLATLIANPGRSSAEVIFYDGTEQRRYRARVWRDGTIAFRPVKP